MGMTNFIGVVWIIFMIFWWLTAIGTKKRAKINQQKWLNRPGFRIILVIIIFWLLQLPVAHRFLYRDFVVGPAGKIFGIIFLLSGLALAVWARIYLSRNWGMPMSLRENHELVTTGPYAYVRHPIYSGFLLAMLGSALADGIPWLIVFIFLFIYFTYSAKVEEKMMADLFPDQYPEYKKHTKMLIPFVF